MFFISSLKHADSIAHASPLPQFKIFLSTQVTDGLFSKSKANCDTCSAINFLSPLRKKKPNKSNKTMTKTLDKNDREGFWE